MLNKISSTPCVGDVLEMAPVATTSMEGPSHDYTEGASAIDINIAVASNRRARRDSQFSTYYDDGQDGSMFSGPGHSVNPSSVSRMSNVELGRRTSDTWSRSRRKSHDSIRPVRRSRATSTSEGSQISRQSVEGRDGQETEDDEDAALLDDERSGTYRSRRRRRKSISPPARATMFENLTHIFGRSGAPDAPSTQRPSTSQRSSSRHTRRSRLSDAGSEHALDTDDDVEERWGYSSGEENSDDNSNLGLTLTNDNASITASMEYDSDPPSPTAEGTQQGLPLLGFDPVFGGEARIDINMSFASLDPPPPGPPSRQTVYIPDEDSTIRFIGYDTITWKVWLWRLGCTFSLGILGLLGHWFPRFWLKWVAKEKAFIDSRHGFIVVEVSLSFPFYKLELTGCKLASRSISLLPTHTLDYPYHISTVFSFNPPPGEEGDVVKHIDDYNRKDGCLKRLLVIDYRYSRFALDPRTGLFTMVR